MKDMLGFRLNKDLWLSYPNTTMLLNASMKKGTVAMINYHTKKLEGCSPTLHPEKLIERSLFFVLMLDQSALSISRRYSVADIG